MKKQILSAILSMAILFTAIMPVSAAEVSIPDCPEQSVIDINAEIERAINGETDLELDASDIATATLIKADGTTESVDVYVTTRELYVDRSANADSHIYATTVVAQATVKHNDGKKKKCDVTGTLTLYWTDNFGLENAFEGLDGSWTIDPCASHTLSNRKVELEGGGPPVMGTHDFYRKNLTADSFHISKGAVRDRWTFYRATSWVTIDGEEILEVNAATSILT